MVLFVRILLFEFGFGSSNLNFGLAFIISGEYELLFSISIMVMISSDFTSGETGKLLTLSIK
jgi:hypothetical protein